MNWLVGTYCSVVNRDVLLDNILFYEVLLFLIYLWYQNTWLPSRINLILSLVKWTGKSNLLLENFFYPEQVNQCSQYGVFLHLFYKILSSVYQLLYHSCFCIIKYTMFFYLSYRLQIYTLKRSLKNEKEIKKYLIE